ncbi:MAG: hypothetical protein NZM12_06365, partial [Steroidobacteraceae bacterium]|nr:hypothetical protein [Steroidobacteraceae bacterium]
QRTAGADYGNRAECEALMADIETATALLAQKPPPITEWRDRAERIRRAARYRNANDTVPTEDSCNADFPELDPANKGKPLEPRIPNVLAEDSWDLTKLLLR